MKKRFWEYMICGIMCWLVGPPILYFSSIDYFAIKNLSLESHQGNLYSYHDHNGSGLKLIFVDDTNRVYYLSNLLYEETDFEALEKSDLEKDSFEILFEKGTNEVYGFKSDYNTILSKDDALSAQLINPLIWVGLGTIICIFGLVLIVFAFFESKRKTELPDFDQVRFERSLINNGKNLIWIFSVYPLIAVLLKLFEAMIDRNIKFEDGINMIVQRFENTEWVSWHFIAMVTFFLIEYLGFRILRSKLNQIENAVDDIGKIKMMNHGIMLNLSIQSGVVMMFLVFLLFYANTWLLIVVLIYVFLKGYYLLRLRTKKLEAIRHE